jgi:hypothetical protein
MSWKALSKPKKFGGWALVAKTLWVFMTCNSLWRCILVDKYIVTSSMLD